MTQYAQYPTNASSSGGGENVTIIGPKGQTTMANSVSTVINNDQTAPIYTSLGIGATQTATVTSAIVLFVQSTAQYTSVNVGVDNLSVGNVLTFEVSDDSVNWYTVELVQLNTSSFVKSSTVNTNQTLWAGNVSAPSFRIRCSTFVSGSAGCSAYFKYEANPFIASGSQILGPFGQTTMANSVPVTFASNQSGLAVSQSGTWSVRNQDGSGTSLTSSTAGAKAGLNTNDVGYTLVQFITRDYSTGNVTTAAYTQLIGATSSTYQVLEIYDTSGQIMKIAYGGAGSEVDQFVIPQGGNGAVLFYCPVNTRISIRAITATASTGYLVLNFYG